MNVSATVISATVIKDEKMSQQTNLKNQVVFQNDLPKWSYPVLRCRLSTITEMIDVLLLLSNDSWVFRGHVNANWKLQTSLERMYGANKVNVESEKRAIIDFRNKVRLHLDLNDSYVDTLAAMQHYGVPTRMLDFTRSFFVALYFAFDCENNYKRNYKNHAVWAMNLDKVLLNSNVIREDVDKDVTNIISNMDDDNVDANTYDAFSELIEDELQRDYVSRFEKIRKVAEDILKGGGDRNKSGIMPIDVPESNARMLAQNGLFIMTTDFSAFEDCLSSEFSFDGIQSMVTVHVDELKEALKVSHLCLTKLILHDDLLCYVRDILKAANIENKTLFPDLSGIASQIRYE